MPASVVPRTRFLQYTLEIRSRRSLQITLLAEFVKGGVGPNDNFQAFKD